MKNRVISPSAEFGRRTKTIGREELKKLGNLGYDVRN